MNYDFGPRHPLRPERLERMMALLHAVAPELQVVDPGLARESDAIRVHDQEYLDLVMDLSRGAQVDPAVMFAYGFSYGDTPPFSGMWQAALAYCGAGKRAAEAVRDGATLAFNMGGGLHHAQRSRAGGFCILSDCALAISILRERFERVAYIDIDLHHGDGVQWDFFDDPNVLTFSIHQDGRTLYPGTGHVEETGEVFTSLNLPLAPQTTGDTWLWALRETLLPAVEAFRPEAIVLQMGCDAHFSDPLGHLRVSVQEWLDAVALVRDLGLPVVGCGGGGYDLKNVPRMWTGAVLTLAGQPIPELIPAQIPQEWGMTTFEDQDLPAPRWSGRSEAEGVVPEVLANIKRINS